MKKIFIAVCLLMVMTLAHPQLSVVYAADEATPPEETATQPALNVFEGPKSADFKALNPFEMFNSPYKNNFTSPAGIINRVLLFAFPLAGLLLFLFLVWGGLEMIIGATNKKSMDQARQRITAAVVGFGLLFVSFWIIQIVEFIFNIAIL